MTALIGPLHRSRDVHAQAEIRFPHGLQKTFGRYAVVENRGSRRWYIQAGDHGVEIRVHVPLPVRERIHRFRRAQRSSMTRVSQIDGMKAARHLEKLAELRNRVFVVPPPAAHSEND